jgi:DNA repair exonuclease SbcCD nuclease subunit
MRFIHAADLHLDSPMAGLRARHGTRAIDIAAATRAAFRRMIDTAIREKVDLVLIAGDVFDRDLSDFAAGLFFVSGLSDLGKAGIRVALIRGNHDAEGRISRNLGLPPNVHEFGSRAASTYLLEDLGVAIHGQSFPDRAVTENLAAAYPSPKPGLLNIGLLHTSADGNYGHDTYAPCSLDDLVGKGYDYWALGHVHRRLVLSQDPWVVFPGNLQGRHVNEPGEKGFTLVTVEAGQVRDLTHCPADTLRWVDLRIDLSRAATLDAALPFVAGAFAIACAGGDDRAIAARLRLIGASPAHGALIAERTRLEAECDSLAEQAPATILIEKILIETRPASHADGPSLERADLVALLRAVSGNVHEAAELRLALEDALGRLPPALTCHAEVGLVPIGDDRFEKLIAEAVALLAHRLGAAERRR